VRPEGLGKIRKKFIYVIGSRTRDLPACSIVPRRNVEPPSSLSNIQPIVSTKGFVNFYKIILRHVAEGKPFIVTDLRPKRSKTVYSSDTGY
jgi:hypothetical protein